MRKPKINPNKQLLSEYEKLLRRYYEAQADVYLHAIEKRTHDVKYGKYYDWLFVFIRYVGVFCVGYIFGKLM